MRIIRVQKYTKPDCLCLFRLNVTSQLKNLFATAFLLLFTQFLHAERVIQNCEASDMDDQNALFSVNPEASFYLFPVEHIDLKKGPQKRRKILLSAWVDSAAVNESFFLLANAQLSDSLGNSIGQSITYQSVHDLRRDVLGVKVLLIGYLNETCLDKSTIAENWLEKALAIPKQAVYRDSIAGFKKNFNPVVNKQVKDYEEWRLDEQLPYGLRIQLVFYKNILQRGVFSRPVNIETRESKVQESRRYILYFQHLDDKNKDRLNKAFPLTTL